MKNYLLVLLSVLGVGFLINHSMPSDSDLSLEITPYTEIQAEEVLLKELPEIPEITSEEIASTPVMTVKAPTSGKSSSNGYSYQIGAVDSTVVKTPGNYIRRAGNLVYGHNSNALLGTIRSLGTGATFEVVEKNGEIGTYRVASVQIFKKINDTTLELCNISDYNNCNGMVYYMSSFTGATFQGKSYSIALMTCDGTSLGGGDATHRRVVFAYKV